MSRISAMLTYHRVTTEGMSNSGEVDEALCITRRTIHGLQTGVNMLGCSGGEAGRCIDLHQNMKDRINFLPIASYLCNLVETHGGEREEIIIGNIAKDIQSLDGFGLQTQTFLYLTPKLPTVLCSTDVK
jgi:hypothetical protein